MRQVRKLGKESLLDGAASHLTREQRQHLRLGAPGMNTELYFPKMLPCTGKCTNHGASRHLG